MYWLVLTVQGRRMEERENMQWAVAYDEIRDWLEERRSLITSMMKFNVDDHRHWFGPVKVCIDLFRLRFGACFEKGCSVFLDRAMPDVMHFSSKRGFCNSDITPAAWTRRNPGDDIHICANVDVVEDLKLMINDRPRGADVGRTWYYVEKFY